MFTLFKYHVINLFNYKNNVLTSNLIFTIDIHLKPSSSSWTLWCPWQLFPLLIMSNRGLVMALVCAAGEMGAKHLSSSSGEGFLITGPFSPLIYFSMLAPPPARPVCFASCCPWPPTWLNLVNLLLAARLTWTWGPDRPGAPPIMWSQDPDCSDILSLPHMLVSLWCYLRLYSLPWCCWLLFPISLVTSLLSLCSLFKPSPSLKTLYSSPAWRRSSQSSSPSSSSGSRLTSPIVHFQSLK